MRIGGMSPASNSSSIVPSEWSSDERVLRDFVKQLPKFGKVRRGQYSCVGSGKKLHDVIYIHSLYASQCIVAESYFSGKGASTFAIPVTYVGLFDVLSEDRKAAKPITNATELMDSNSKLFLVREGTKVAADSSSMTLRRKGELEPGEILRLNEKQSSSRTNKIFSFQDESNRNVLLDASQKFSFSPLSKSDDVGGVHSIASLAKHFCFPMTVQLAKGEFFSSSNYRPIFRLLGVTNVEFAMVIPLKASTQVLSIPLSEILVMSPPRDQASLKDSEEFKQISNFASAVEAQQRKTISFLTIGNLKFYRNKVHEADEEVATNSEADHSIYEEIDVIYKYIREGGELSDFSGKDQTQPIPDNADNSTNQRMTGPTRPMDSLEREIWEEPIYVDVSKLKARKLTGGRQTSGDSELANIGMEQGPGNAPAKMTSTYKKSLQKYKNKIISTLQSKPIELETKSIFQMESFPQQLQASASKSEAIEGDDNDPVYSFKQVEVHEDNSKPSLLSSKLMSERDPSEVHESIREEGFPQKQQLAEIQLQNVAENSFDSTPRSALQASVGKGTLDEKAAKKNNKSLNDDEFGWNVSIFKHSNDEGDSKKTRVKINYNHPAVTGVNYEDGMNDDIAREDFRILKSEDESVITFKNTGNKTDQPELEMSSIKFESQDEVLDGCGYTEDTLDSFQNPSSSFSHSTTHDCPATFPVSVTTLDLCENSSFNANTESCLASSEPPSTFSENVSTIRLGSYAGDKSHLDSNERSEDAQSVRIICNKTTSYAGTMSSKTFLGALTLQNHQIQTTADDPSQANSYSQNYQTSPGITTIKIEKSGAFRHVADQQSDFQDRQVIQKSPFGNTQIYIRQTYPSKPSSSASKLYINKTFF